MKSSIPAVYLPGSRCSLISLLLDPSATLLFPSSTERLVAPAYPINQIIGMLATRFEAEPEDIQLSLPNEIQLWGRVRIFKDGDVLHAAKLTKMRIDSRDATYVRVCTTRLFASGVQAVTHAQLNTPLCCSSTSYLWI